jgi:hypothetical protein
VILVVTLAEFVIVTISLDLYFEGARTGKG